MKTLMFLLFFLPTTLVFAQHTPLPHGMIYGDKPNTVGLMPATNLEHFMDTKPRISTTIEGKVIKVTKTEGGWFQIDAGNGEVIAAHFKDYNITIPTDMKGRTVIIEGVAAREFIADDLQHMAGDTVTGKKQQTVKADPKRSLTFEVKGLMVDK